MAQQASTIKKIALLRRRLSKAAKTSRQSSKNKPGDSKE
jgi:hypothetical protein